MKPDTLIILSPGFPKNEADSNCLPGHQNFVKTLNACYPLIKIVILAFDYPMVLHTYQWQKNTVYPFNGYKKNKVLKLYRFLRIWLKLNKIRRSHHIVGLLSFWCGECAFIGKHYAKRNQLPHFCWLLGQDAKKDNPYVRRTNPSANELVAISDFIQNEFKKNYGIVPQQVIPLGILAAEFLHQKKPVDIDILGAGSLIALKQFDLFIEIVKDLKEYFPVIKVALCGKGPEENKLIELINKYGLQKNITLLGEVPHTALLEYMQRSKVFLHTSSYEGFSGVCLEAIYAGIPVVSFCKPMTREIKNWYCVDSPAEMMEKTLGLLTKTDSVYLPQIPFSMEQTANKIMQLFGLK